MKKGIGKKPDVAPLRRRAEDRLKEKNPEMGPAPNKIDLERLVHELQVHQIELEMQNEELKRAREKSQRPLQSTPTSMTFPPSAISPSTRRVLYLS